MSRGSSTTGTTTTTTKQDRRKDYHSTKQEMLRIAAAYDKRDLENDREHDGLDDELNGEHDEDDDEQDERFVPITARTLPSEFASRPIARTAAPTKAPLHSDHNLVVDSDDAEQHNELELDADDDSCDEQFFTPTSSTPSTPTETGLHVDPVQTLAHASSSPPDSTRVSQAGATSHAAHSDSLSSLSSSTLTLTPSLSLTGTSVTSATSAQKSDSVSPPSPRRRLQQSHQRRSELKSKPQTHQSEPRPPTQSAAAPRPRRRRKHLSKMYTDQQWAQDVRWLVPPGPPNSATNIGSATSRRRFGAEHRSDKDREEMTMKRRSAPPALQMLESSLSLQALPPSFQMAPLQPFPSRHSMSNPGPAPRLQPFPSVRQHRVRPHAKSLSKLNVHPSAGMSALMEEEEDSEAEWHGLGRSGVHHLGEGGDISDPGPLVDSREDSEDCDDEIGSTIRNSLLRKRSQSLGSPLTYNLPHTRSRSKDRSGEVVRERRKSSSAISLSDPSTNDVTHMPPHDSENSTSSVAKARSPYTSAPKTTVDALSALGLNPVPTGTSLRSSTSSSSRTVIPSVSTGYDALPSSGTRGYTGLVLPRVAPSSAPLRPKSGSWGWIWRSKSTSASAGLQAYPRGHSMDELGVVDLTRAGLAQTTMASVEIVKGIAAARAGGVGASLLSLGSRPAVKSGETTLKKRRSIFGGNWFGGSDSSKTERRVLVKDKARAKNGLPSTSGSTLTLSVNTSARPTVENLALYDAPSLTDSPLVFTAYRTPPVYVSAGAVLVQVWAVGLDGVDMQLVGVRPHSLVGGVLGEMVQKKERSKYASVGYIPGRSFVGRVLEVGWDVRGDVVKKGEWVIGLLPVSKCGALAEFILVDRHRVHRIPLPRLASKTLFPAATSSNVPLPLQSIARARSLAFPADNRPRHRHSLSLDLSRNFLAFPSSNASSPGTPGSRGSSPIPSPGLRKEKEKEKGARKNKCDEGLSIEELALLPITGVTAYRAVRTMAEITRVWKAAKRANERARAPVMDDPQPLRISKPIPIPVSVQIDRRRSYAADSAGNPILPYGQRRRRATPQIFAGCSTEDWASTPLEDDNPPTVSRDEESSYFSYEPPRVQKPEPEAPSVEARPRVLILRAQDGPGAMALQMLVRAGWSVWAHVPVPFALPGPSPLRHSEEEGNTAEIEEEDMEREARRQVLRTIESRLRGWGAEEVLFVPISSVLLPSTLQYTPSSQSIYNPPSSASSSPSLSSNASPSPFSHSSSVSSSPMSSPYSHTIPSSTTHFSTTSYSLSIASRQRVLPPPYSFAPLPLTAYGSEPGSVAALCTYLMFLRVRFDGMLDTLGGRDVWEAGKALLGLPLPITAAKDSSSDEGDGDSDSDARLSERDGMDAQFTTLIGDSPYRVIPTAGDHFRASVRALRRGAGAVDNITPVKTDEEDDQGYILQDGDQLQMRTKLKTWSRRKTKSKLKPRQVNYAWVSIGSDLDLEGGDIRDSLEAVLKMATEGVKPFVETGTLSRGGSRGNLLAPEEYGRVIPFEQTPKLFVPGSKLDYGGTVAVKIAG